MKSFLKRASILLFIYKNTIFALSGGFGYFMMGSQMFSDISSLNSEMLVRGYPEISNSGISIGGGGHAVVDRVIIGGEGSGILTKKSGNSNFSVDYSYGYGCFDLGYVVYNSKSIFVYPMLGIGGGGMTLSIFEKTLPSFGDVLDNPKRGVVITTGGLLLNFSLGLDYLLKVEDSYESRNVEKRGVGGFVVGIRTGYILSVVKSDWSLPNEVVLSNSPQVGLDGFYIKVLIGFSGYEIK